jgi:hypothetical protein
VTSVADPGYGAFLTPGPGMNNPDHISESLETIFWVKIYKFFDTDPGWKKLGSEMEKVQIRDPGQTSQIRNTGCDEKQCFFHI